MARIVALGLKKQPRDRPYRMSRAGQMLFHYIKTIASKNKTETIEEIQSGVNKNNLTEIKKKAKSTKFFTIAHVNVRYIRNKAPQVQLELGTQGIDICPITETWLKPDEEESILLQQITPPGDNIISYPRSNGKTGAALAVVHRNHIQLQNHCILQTLLTMECGHFQIKFGLDMVSLFIIYCIPNTTLLQFCEEMVSIFENSIKTIRNNILLMGDFNIHMDTPDDPNTIIFNDLLNSFNLRNNISFQTHISGHTLHLILDDQNESLAKCVKKGHSFADHSLVQATICMEKCDPLQKSVTYSKLKNINETDCLTECNTILMMIWRPK